MRITDGSSDVGTADLILPRQHATGLIVTPYSAVARICRYRAPHNHRNISARQRAEHRIARSLPEDDKSVRAARAIEILERARIIEPGRRQDRTSVVEGKSVSVRVVVGGRRTIQKQNTS